MSAGTPEEPRIWHASRDAYHCAFRLLRLLTFTTDGVLEFDRLRVLDLLLLFPPVLHRTSMTRQLRRQFESLNVPEPEKTFVQIPSAAALFQDLRLYQNTAMGHLTALN